MAGRLSGGEQIASHGASSGDQPVVIEHCDATFN
jgi:hypothetical protein